MIGAGTGGEGLSGFLRGLPR